MKILYKEELANNEYYLIIFFIVMNFFIYPNLILIYLNY